MQIELRKSQYNFSKAEKVCQEAWDQVNANIPGAGKEDGEKPLENCDLLGKKMKLDGAAQEKNTDLGNAVYMEEELPHKKSEKNGFSKVGPVDDSDLIAIR